MSTQKSKPQTGEIGRVYAEYEQALAVAQSLRDELSQLEHETLLTRESAMRGDADRTPVSVLHAMRGRLATLHRLIEEAHANAREHYTRYVNLTEEANEIRLHIKQLEQHAEKIDRAMFEQSSFVTPAADLGPTHSGWNPYQGSVTGVELTRLAHRLRELVGT